MCQQCGSFLNALATIYSVVMMPIVMRSLHCALCIDPRHTFANVCVPQPNMELNWQVYGFVSSEDESAEYVSSVALLLCGGVYVCV